MRMIDMPISARTISNGRSGLTKTWPRLRDHISSRKEIDMPIWLRSVTSHSSTPPSRVAPAMTGGTARDGGTSGPRCGGTSVSGEGGSYADCLPAIAGDVQEDVLHVLPA